MRVEVVSGVKKLSPQLMLDQKPDAGLFVFKFEELRNNEFFITIRRVWIFSAYE